MPERIRILIVDDHPVVRDGLVAMLSTQPDFEVVAQASEGEEALLKIERFEPDMVLLDLEMPGLDGAAILQRLRNERKPVNSIVFTAFDTDDRIVSAIRAGAKGILLKGSPRSEIFHAIRVAGRGGSLVQPVAASLLRQPSGSPDSNRTGPFAALTAREKEVLDLMGRGRTNREIAAELFITERTVKFHVSSILNKMGAGNRTEAVTMGAQQGLIRL